MEISDEVIGPSSGDLIGRILRRQMDAHTAAERAKLAAVTDDYTAWMAYPPTRHDDPAEYAPYWSRLADVVTDEGEREAIVAAFLAG